MGSRAECTRDGIHDLDKRFSCGDCGLSYLVFHSGSRLSHPRTMETCLLAWMDSPLSSGLFSAV